MSTNASDSTTRRLLIPGVRVGAVLVLVVVAAWSGLGDAGDRMLRRPEYRLRGERASAQRVMLVAIDAPTIAAWGPPPWRGPELAGLLDTLAASASTVGVVEDPARLGALPPTVISGPVGLDLDGTVEAVSLGDATAPTATARIAAAANLRLGDTINYIGRRGLPTVSAIDVARGAIPRDTFRSKIVVVGLTAQPYAGLVPTPVGPLAPAQVHAHALAAAADGVAWATMPGALHWLVIVVACALGFVLAHRLSMVRATIATLLVIAALLVVDHVLFATGVVLFGVTLPILAVFAVAVVERLYERTVLQRHAAEIAHWTRRWMLAETVRDPDADEKPGYWRRVGELARLYLGATSSIIADLPVGSQHLELRVVGPADAQQIRERRLDVRRSPYRKAHVTLGPVWHDGYLATGSTLIVPLIVRTNLVGFWMLNFERRDAVTASHMALIKTLASEIARVIDRRRAPAPKPPRGLVGWLIGARPFTFELEDVKRAFHMHAQNQQDLLTIGEALPFGVFVSTLWGDVRYANSAMKKLCTQRSIDLGSTETDLAELLSVLTLRGAAGIHAELRELVQAEGELYLHGDHNDVVLSWLGREGDEAERLVVGWVLPGSAGKPSNKTVDEHARTALRRRDDFGLASRHSQQRLEFSITRGHAVDDSAMTRPRPKQEADDLQLAHGTPTDSPRVDPADLLGTRTLVPDATFKTPKVIVEESEDEITQVGNGDAPKPDATKRFFNIKFDS